MFDICPLTMRTKGILLVRDAISVLNSYSADSKAALGAPLLIATDLCNLQMLERRRVDKNHITSWFLL